MARHLVLSLPLAATIVLIASASAAPGPVPVPVPTETIVVSPDTAAEDAAPLDEAPPDDVGPAPSAVPATEIPTVEYDAAKLPPAVARIREQIIAAAATGDPEALRIVIDAGDPPPELGEGPTGDPIVHLLSLSGDTEGREILAVLIEVLDAGYVHVDAGTPDEMYIWPYFARYPVEALTPPQLVELFKLVYAGDYEDMLAYGLYTSYRVGITPNGGWSYFLAD